MASKTELDGLGGAPVDTVMVVVSPSVTQNTVPRLPTTTSSILATEQSMVSVVVAVPIRGSSIINEKGYIDEGLADAGCGEVWLANSTMRTRS